MKRLWHRFGKIGRTIWEKRSSNSYAMGIVILDEVTAFQSVSSRQFSTLISDFLHLIL